MQGTGTNQKSQEGGSRHNRGIAATVLAPFALLGTAMLVAIALLAALPMSASAVVLRAGDVGFSGNTPAGSMWVYGDSWVDGRLIRNAITLNGNFTGEIRGVQTGHWVWPGQPFPLPNGRYAMYGTEMTQATPGMWGFAKVGGVRAVFDPASASAASVTPMPSTGLYWSAASTGGWSNPLVYTVDANHKAHVGRPNADGSVTDLRNMGGTISGQYSVITDASGKWWMVGQLPFLSRRVVAYPLAGRAGPVTGSYVPLATLPIPGSTRYTYAATVHPDYSGLLTWAVNGSGAGTAYGLQRLDGFWPKALDAGLTLQSGTAARAAVARLAHVAGVATPKTAVAAQSLARKVQVDINDRIESADEAARLETNLEQSEGWLAPPPEQLAADQSAMPGSPATLEFAGRGHKAPEGEDSVTDRQAGLRLAKGRDKVEVGNSRSKSKSTGNDLSEYMSKIPSGWTRKGESLAARLRAIFARRD